MSMWGDILMSALAACRRTLLVPIWQKVAWTADNGKHNLCPIGTLHPPSRYTDWAARLFCRIFLEMVICFRSKQACTFSHKFMVVMMGSSSSSLFNDAFNSNSYYIASNERLTGEILDCKACGRKRSWPNFKVAGICLEWLRKIMWLDRIAGLRAGI
jgi:hypothetical protein